MEPQAQIIVPNPVTQAPAVAADGEDVILMEFEHRVRLTVDVNHVIDFPAGIHPVPRRHADHWYLKAHGVKLYKVPVAIKSQVEKEAKPA